MEDQLELLFLDLQARDTGVKNQLKAIIDDAKASVKSIELDVQVAGNADKAAASADKARASFQSLKEVGEAVSVQFRGQQVTVGSLSQALKLLSREQQGLRSQFVATGKDSKRISEGLEEVGREAQRLQRNFKDVPDAFGRFGVVAAQAQRSVDGIAGRMSRLGLASQVSLSLQRELTTQFARYGPLGNAAALGFNAFGASLSSATTLALGLAGALAGVALGIAKLTQEGLPQFKEFERGLNIIRAAAEDANSNFNFNELKNELKELQAEGGRAAQAFTRAQLAGALAETVKAGTDAAQALDILGASTKLAAAEGENLSESSALILQNIRQFGLAATDAAAVGDALAKAGLLAAGTARELSEGLAIVGPAAAAANSTLFETLGLLVELDNKGLSAAEIGATGLRNVFTALADPTKEALGVFQDLNIELRDAEGNFRPIARVLEDLRKSLQDSGVSFNALTGELVGSSQALQQAASIFDTRGVTAILALGDNVDLLTDKIANSSGTLDTYADTLQDGLAPAGERLSVAFKDLASTFVEVFGPGLTNQVNFLANELRTIGNFLDAVNSRFGGNEPIDYANATEKAARALSEVSGATTLLSTLNALGETLTGEAKAAWDEYTLSVLANRDALIDYAKTAAEAQAVFEGIAGQEQQQRETANVDDLREKQAAIAVEIGKLENQLKGLGDAKNFSDLQANLSTLKRQLADLATNADIGLDERLRQSTELREQITSLERQIRLQGEVNEKAGNLVEKIDEARQRQAELNAEANKLLFIYDEFAGIDITPQSPFPGFATFDFAATDTGINKNLERLVPRAVELITNLNKLKNSGVENAAAFQRAQQALVLFENSSETAKAAVEAVRATLERTATSSTRSAATIRTSATVLNELAANLKAAPRLELALGDDFDEAAFKASALTGAITELISKFDFDPAGETIRGLIADLNAIPPSLAEVRAERKRLADSFTDKLLIGVEFQRIDAGVARQQLEASLLKLQNEIKTFDGAALGLSTEEAQASLNALNELVKLVEGSLNDLTDIELDPDRLNLDLLTSDAETGRQSLAAVSEQLELLASGLQGKLDNLTAQGLTALNIQAILDTQQVIDGVEGLQDDIAEQRLDTLTLQVELGLVDAAVIEAGLKAQLGELRQVIISESAALGLDVDLDLQDPSAIEALLQAPLTDLPPALREAIEEYQRLEAAIENVTDVRLEQERAFAENLVLGIEYNVIPAAEAQATLEADLEKLQLELKQKLEFVLSITGEIDPSLKADIADLEAQVENLKGLLAGDEFQVEIPIPEIEVSDSARQAELLGQALIDLSKTAESVAFRQNVLGESLDSNAELIEAYRSKLRELEAQGVDPNSEGFQNLITTLKELEAVQDDITASTLAASIAQERYRNILESRFSGSQGEEFADQASLRFFTQAVEGAESLEDALQSLSDKGIVVTAEGLERLQRRFAFDVAQRNVEKFVEDGRRKARLYGESFNELEATAEGLRIELNKLENTEGVPETEIEKLAEEYRLTADGIKVANRELETFNATQQRGLNLQEVKFSGENAFLATVQAVERTEGAFKSFEDAVIKLRAAGSDLDANFLGFLDERFNGAFQSISASIEAINGVSQSTFQKLSNEIVEAGLASGLSADQVAKLREELEKAEDLRITLSVQDLNTEIFTIYAASLSRLEGKSGSVFDGLRGKIREQIQALESAGESAEDLRNQLLLIDLLDLDLGLVELTSQIDNLAGGNSDPLRKIRTGLQEIAQDSNTTAEQLAEVNEQLTRLSLLEISEGLGALAVSLDVLQTTFDDLDTEVVGAFASITRGLQALTKVAAQETAEIQDYFGALADTLSQETNEELAAAGRSMQAVVDIIANLSTGNFLGAIGGVLAIIVEIGAAFGREAKRARELQEALDKLSESYDTLSESTIKAFGAFEGKGKPLEDQPILDFGQDIAETFAEGVQGGFDSINFNELITQKLIKDLAKTDPRVIQKINEIMAAYRDAIADGIITADEASGIQGLFDDLEELGEKVRQDLLDLGIDLDIESQPLEGSIAFLEQELRKLQEEFKNATTDAQRSVLQAKIEELEEIIARLEGADIELEVDVKAPPEFFELPEATVNLSKILDKQFGIEAENTANFTSGVAEFNNGVEKIDGVVTVFADKVDAWNTDLSNFSVSAPEGFRTTPVDVNVTSQSFQQSDGVAKDFRKTVDTFRQAVEFMAETPIKIVNEEGKRVDKRSSSYLNRSRFDEL